MGGAVRVSSDQHVIMLSVYLQKNPTVKNNYWTEVCRKDERPHLFHASTTLKPADRTTPMSTMQASYHSGNLVRDVCIYSRCPTPRRTELSSGRSTASALTAGGRSCLATPRSDRSSSRVRRGIERRIPKGDDLP